MRSSVGSAAKAGLAGGQTSESSSMPASIEARDPFIYRQKGLRPLEELLLSSFDLEKSCRATKTPMLLMFKNGRR